MKELRLEDLVEGDKYEGVLLETISDSSRGHRRVRPVAILPRSLNVEFPKKIRELRPLGSRFRADLVVRLKHYADGTPKGGLYLRAIFPSIVLLDEYKAPAPAENRDIGDLESLRRKAYAKATDELEPKARETMIRERNRIIREYALARSNGVCEACDNAAPFITRNGEPYLEVHHIVPVADGGADNPRNVAAVCPNCHRRVERSQDAEDYNNQLAVRIKDLEARLPLLP